MRFFFFFFLFVFGIINSQSYISFDTFFSKSEKQIANTATKISYLKNTEKEVFYYLNLVRINPRLFAQTFLIENKDKIDCSREYKSLYRKLMNMSPLKPIYFDNEFYLLAKCHAIESGKLDYIGHNRKKGSGCDPIISNYSWGECCYYGENDPLSIVLDLLVDCNYSDLGHRKIMLSDKFNYMGVYIAPHKSYKYNAVLDFRGE